MITVKKCVYLCTAVFLLTALFSFNTLRAEEKAEQAEEKAEQIKVGKKLKGNLA